jgi:hypothetical protein
MTAPLVPVALHHRLAALLWRDLPVLDGNATAGTPAWRPVDSKSPLPLAWTFPCHPRDAYHPRGPVPAQSPLAHDGRVPGHQLLAAPAQVV